MCSGSASAVSSQVLSHCSAPTRQWSRAWHRRPRIRFPAPTTSLGWHRGYCVFVAVGSCHAMRMSVAIVASEGLFETMPERCQPARLEPGHDSLAVLYIANSSLVSAQQLGATIAAFTSVSAIYKHFYGVWSCPESILSRRHSSHPK